VADCPKQRLAHAVEMPVFDTVLRVPLAERRNRRQKTVDVIPRDAVAVLQPALRGKVDASNYYATHTEVHALLARAWDSGGRADSASVHYAWVARAWANGDAPYAERAAVAQKLSVRQLGLLR
jgi:hypothetical protein